jgi:phosphoserine phosphatase
MASSPTSRELSAGYASVVLDVDSTLCGIEGIDWLAARRGPEAGVRIAELTDRAMNGELALDDVYGERLGVVRPTRGDLEALASAYEGALAPGAAAAIARMRAAGRRIVLVSGGIRNAILPVARRLGIDDTDVHAVNVLVDDAGEYETYDAHSPMTTAEGKRSVVASLGLPRRPRRRGRRRDGPRDPSRRRRVHRVHRATCAASPSSPARTPWWNPSTSSWSSFSHDRFAAHAGHLLLPRTHRGAQPRCSPP